MTSKWLKYFVRPNLRSNSIPLLTTWGQHFTGKIMRKPHNEAHLEWYKVVSQHPHSSAQYFCAPEVFNLFIFLSDWSWETIVSKCSFTHSWQPTGVFETYQQTTVDCINWIFHAALVKCRTVPSPPAAVQSKTLFSFSSICLLAVDIPAFGALALQTVWALHPPLVWLSSMYKGHGCERMEALQETSPDFSYNAPVAPLRELPKPFSKEKALRSLLSFSFLDWICHEVCWRKLKHIWLIFSMSNTAAHFTSTS